MCHFWHLKKVGEFIWTLHQQMSNLSKCRIMLHLYRVWMGLYWPEKVPFVQLCTVCVAWFTPTRDFLILAGNPDVSLFIRHILCSKIWITEKDLNSIALSKMNEELLMCAFLYSHCTAWYCMVLLGTVYCLALYTAWYSLSGLKKENCTLWWSWCRNEQRFATKLEAINAFSLYQSLWLKIKECQCN